MHEREREREREDVSKLAWHLRADSFDAFHCVGLVTADGHRSPQEAVIMQSWSVQKTGLCGHERQSRSGRGGVSGVLVAADPSMEMSRNPADEPRDGQSHVQHPWTERAEHVSVRLVCARSQGSGERQDSSACDAKPQRLFLIPPLYSAFRR